MSNISFSFKYNITPHSPAGLFIVIVDMHDTNVVVDRRFYSLEDLKEEVSLTIEVPKGKYFIYFKDAIDKDTEGSLLEQFLIETESEDKHFQILPAANEPITSELLTLYKFKLIDPTTAQGGDTWEREGFQVTQVDGTSMFSHGKGDDKVAIESFEHLQVLWKKEKGTELTLSV